MRIFSESLRVAGEEVAVQTGSDKRADSRILNFGSLNIDKVYKVPHFVRPGETISSLGYQCFPGGKGLNQSIAVSRAGHRICHAGTIGADGGILEEVLTGSGVDTRYVRKTESITGHALIQVSDAGENCIILFPGSNHENDQAYMEKVFSDFGEGDILMLQNEISNLDFCLQKGREKGMRIMLNPSPMDERLRRADFSGVTWLMLNETEGQEMTGEREPQRILDKLLERYPKLQVILTLGGEGAVYGSKSERISQPCYPAEVVDTTAAGDTFTGFFVAAVAEKKSAAEALRLAAMAAAITVSGEGAAVSIPDRSAVEERLSII